MTFLKPTLAALTVAGLLLALPATDSFAHAKVPATHHVLAAAAKKTAPKAVKVTKAVPAKKHAAAPAKKTAHTATAHKAKA